MFNLIRSITSYFTKKEEIAPKTFEEAVSKFKEYIKDDREFGRYPEIGRWVRNTFGLWNAESELWKDMFEKFDIGHADDMYMLIEDCAIKDLNGQPREEEKIVKFCKDHWAKLNVDYMTGNRLEPDPDDERLA